MNFLEKLDGLMANKGIKKTTLSEISKVPYTTIDAFYKKGFENVKMSTIKKLASALDVSLDYLMDDNITDPNYGKLQSFPITMHEARLVKRYRSLDDSGKTFVEDVVQREYDRVTSYRAPLTLAANSGSATPDEVRQIASEAMDALKRLTD